MTRRHNKVVDVVRRAIKEHMVNRHHSGIDEKIKMGGECRTEETRRLRPDLNFVASISGARFTVMIDISSRSGRISQREQATEGVR
jgi:hypothetical protein